MGSAIAAATSTICNLSVTRRAVKKAVVWFSRAPTWDRAAVRDASRSLGFLAVALVLSMSTWFSASAVLPQLRAEWQLGTTAGAWLTIAVQLGFVAGALFS